VFQKCDLDNKGKLNYSEWKLAAVTLCRYTKVEIFDNKVVDSVFPHHRIIWKRLKKYAKEGQDKESEVELLHDIWRRAFPKSDPPEIPSEDWKRLGFQGANPEVDFKDTGQIGLQCFLQLSKHRAFMTFLRVLTDSHHVPLAEAAFNVVMLIFELLGWGSNSPGIPCGQLPITFQSLCKILFMYSSKIDIDEGFQDSLVWFYKLYLLFMGLMAGVLQEMKTGYVEFPIVVEKTTERAEQLLLLIKDRCNLDRYLVECFGLEIDALSSDKIFQIWLRDFVCESIVYTGDSKLNVILKKLAIVKKLTVQEHKAYYTTGKPVPDINITLQDFGKKVVYYLPYPPQAAMMIPSRQPIARNPEIKKSSLKNIKVAPSSTGSKTKSNKSVPKPPSKKTDKKTLPTLSKTKSTGKQRASYVSPKIIQNIIQQEIDMASSETTSENNDFLSYHNSLSKSPKSYTLTNYKPTEPQHEDNIFQSPKSFTLTNFKPLQQPPSYFESSSQNMHLGGESNILPIRKHSEFPPSVIEFYSYYKNEFPVDPTISFEQDDYQSDLDENYSNSSDEEEDDDYTGYCSNET